MTVVSASVLITTVTAVAVSTSVGLHGVLVQQDILPPPTLLLMDTMSGVTGFTAVLQQQTLKLRPIIPMVLCVFNR